MQALSGLNFQKFKEAVENYTFKMTKPPKNDDAFQQVSSPPAPPLRTDNNPRSCCPCFLVMTFMQKLVQDMASANFSPSD